MNILIAIIYILALFCSSVNSLISFSTYRAKSLSFNQSKQPSAIARITRQKANFNLDPDTINALGSVVDSSDSLDATIEAVTPLASVATKLVASPLIIAVPIGAGLLVALGFGYFIFWYGKGSD